MKNVWLVGSDGMLGTQIKNKLTANSIDSYFSDKKIDITNPNILNEFTKNKNFDWIINCAAFTDVDKAENNQEDVFDINSGGAENLARIAISKNATLIHFSTDYVYKGDKKNNYNESDNTDPLSIYGKSKLLGEKKIIKTTNKYFILRLSWLYGIHGKNFVKTIVHLLKNRKKIKVIDDQIGSPTYCEVLAENIVKLINSNKKKYGIYNYSDEGKISWYDFALEIKKNSLQKGLLKNDKRIEPITSGEYKSKAKRPKNSFMNKSKIKKELKFKVKNWKTNLKKYFDEWGRINYA